MSDQTNDLKSFARHLLTMPGVSGVWLMSGPTRDRDGMIYVTVRGFDPEAHGHRIEVTRTVERYIADNREAMRDAQFIFDYAVLVEDDELETAHIPASAEPILNPPEVTG